MPEKPLRFGCGAVGDSDCVSTGHLGRGSFSPDFPNDWESRSCIYIVTSAPGREVEMFPWSWTPTRISIPEWC